MRYRTIVLDPPWNERGGGKVKRGADRHYKTMSAKAIVKTVLESGAFTPDRNGCSVWVWATANYLDDALWVMDRLGAEYVTNAVWVKAEVIKDPPMADLPPQIYPPGNTPLVVPQAPGLGQRVRMCHEHLLYGRIGRVPVPPTDRRLPSVVYAPRRKHSEKPDEAYRLIESHDGDGPKLDMFARTKRDGWDVWGDEV